MNNRLPGNKRTTWGLVTLMALAVVWIQLFGTVSAAHASGWESHLWSNDGAHPDIISNCNGDSTPKPDKCIFHIVSHSLVTQSSRRVSPILGQCKQSTSADLTFTWSYTSTTSISESITISEGAELLTAMGSGISATYDQSWSWSKEKSTTTGGSIKETVPANYDGWIQFTPKVDIYRGWLEVHYGKRIDGHYFWYYPYQGASSFVVTSPNLNSNNQQNGDLTAHTQLCGHHS
jgi:hypothetical protein